MEVLHEDLAKKKINGVKDTIESTRLERERIRSGCERFFKTPFSFTRVCRIERRACRSEGVGERKQRNVTAWKKVRRRCGVRRESGMRKRPECLARWAGRECWRSGKTVGHDKSCKYMNRRRSRCQIQRGVFKAVK